MGGAIGRDAHAAPGGDAAAHARGDGGVCSVGGVARGRERAPTGREAQQQSAAGDGAGGAVCQAAIRAEPHAADDGGPAGGGSGGAYHSASASADGTDGLCGGAGRPAGARAGPYMHMHMHMYMHMHMHMHGGAGRPVGAQAGPSLYLSPCPCTHTSTHPYIHRFHALTSMPAPPFFRWQRSARRASSCFAGRSVVASSTRTSRAASTHGRTFGRRARTLGSACSHAATSCERRR